MIETGKDVGKKVSSVVVLWVTKKLRVDLNEKAKYFIRRLRKYIYIY